MKSLDRNTIKYKSREISKRSFFAENSPFHQTLKGLGARGAKGFLDSNSERRSIVIGDTLYDWALFHNLRTLSIDIHWVPTALLKNGYSAFDDLLFNLLRYDSDNNSYLEPYIYSATIDSKLMIRTVVNSLQVTRKFFTTPETVVFKIQKYFFKNPTNWLVWGEYNNYTEKCMTINDQGISVEKLPVTKSKNLIIPNQASKYYIDVNFHKYSFLVNPNLHTLPIRWENPNSAKKNDSKTNVDGTLTYWSMSLFVFAGQDLDSVIRTPRIKLTNIFDSFAEIVSKSNYILSKTVGTWTIENSIKLWDNSLENFNIDIFESESQKFFSVYFENLNKSKKEKNPILESSAGIFFENKFFYSESPSSSYFNPPLMILDDKKKVSCWIDSNIIQRGERLICRTCGSSLFYFEKDLGAEFICKNCSSRNIKNTTTMNSLKPRTLYALNPILNNLYKNNDHIVLKTLAELEKKSEKYFEWISNLIIRDETGKDIQEIDIIANIDGELYIGECKSNSAIDSKQLLSYYNFCINFSIKNIVFGSKYGWSDAKIKIIMNQFSKDETINVHFF